MVVEALQARVSSESAAGRAPGLMRLAANVWALLQVGIWPRRGEGGGENLPPGRTLQEGRHLSAVCLQALDTLDAWTLAQARPNQQQPQAEGSGAVGVTAADGLASSDDLGGGGVR